METVVEGDFLAPTLFGPLLILSKGRRTKVAQLRMRFHNSALFLSCYRKKFYVACFSLIASMDSHTFRFVEIGESARQRRNHHTGESDMNKMIRVATSFGQAAFKVNGTGPCSLPCCRM
ncbi:hypothetical protein LCM4573_23000 [Rhizobium sp. LCM 4573]|nr:hypothetical protein LCM4573_23000 [Rhizobium sp. LCM 4573]